MNNNQGGFSLFEMLVVICIFGILGVITSQIILLSVRGSGKSESLVKVREELNYAVAVMERQLRNANAVTCPDLKTINYTDTSNNEATFSCVTFGENTYIASNSAQITNNDLNITDCDFTCTVESGSPSLVTIYLKAKNTNKSEIESATVEMSTQIYLRSF